MGDATYDAVIIGGGNKGLILAMYLARYGGLSVGIFESRHEAGGGWTTDEGGVPGFPADYHCSAVSETYHITTELDFPEWQELGGKITNARVIAGAIFREDHSCIVTYNRYDDPIGERNAKSIARFSERDAETWMRLGERYREFFRPAIQECLYNPPPPPGEPDALERLWKDSNLFDPSWLVMSPLQVWRELFESDALIAYLLKINYSMLACSPDTPGMGLYVLMFTIAMLRTMGGVVGGTHNWAHAAVKIILGEGGKIFTNSEVNRVVIENGQAKGIVLTDGTEVQAKKLVVSTLDPYTLCFRLIGSEYLNSKILRKVVNLQRWDACIAWYTWALHEPPNYKAASFEPDINEAVGLNLITKDPEALIREAAMRKLGKIPEELLLLVIEHSLLDKSRAPEGKCSALTEQMAVPANLLTEREWLEFKKSHAEAVIKLWQEYAPNMTWDNVIGYVPRTPYDACEMANMAPTGNTGIIDRSIPSQLGRYRPIPELARHRTPIENLYATGSAWHPHGQGACWQAYNCYKIIAEDFGLRKPWEEQGRSF
jgi:phytoene dehydrogenase-like protein